MAEFVKAIPYVLMNEGGDTDHPLDRGGFTRWGITHEVARGHRCVAHPAGLDIDRLTLGDAKHIYQKDYWRFDALRDDRVAAKCLDIVVNLGLRNGTKIIQRAAGVRDDGIFGGQTIAAVNIQLPAMFLDQLATKLADFYVSIVEGRPSQIVFLRGWMRRAIRKPSPI